MDPADATSVPALPQSAPRVRLTIVSGAGSGAHAELQRPVTLIGKRAGCKIALNHPQVFAVHAAIVHTGHEIYVRDLTGKELTFHNDLKAVCERLTNGDVVRIASWEIRVDITVPPMASTPAADDALEREPEIVGFERLDNHRFQKLTRPVMTLGRRPTCDVVLADREVSRVHALLFNYLGYLSICDVLSKNGTLVNDKPVTFSHLNPNDVVGIEAFRLRMSLTPGTPVAKPASAPKASAPSASLDDDDVLDLLMGPPAEHIDIPSPE